MCDWATPIETKTMDERTTALTPGQVHKFGPHIASADEVIAFHDEWAPVHATDGAPSVAAHVYSLCVAERLQAKAPWHAAGMRETGFDQLNFVGGLSPGEPVYLESEVSEFERDGNTERLVVLNRLTDSDGNWIVSFRRSFQVSSDGQPGSGPEAHRSMSDSDALAVGTALAAMKKNNVARDARLSYLSGHLGIDEDEAASVLADFEAGFSLGISQSLGVTAGRNYKVRDETLFAIAVQLGSQSMAEMMNAEAETKARQKKRTQWTVAAFCVLAIALVLAML